MPFAVFITTPRAGMGYAVAPYTVETATTYATIEEAQAVAVAKVLSPAVIALFNAMPPVHPPWVLGTIPEGVIYPVNAYRSHLGKTWRVEIGHTNNGDPSWAPGGAANLWTLIQPPGSTAWASGVVYTLPAEASYDGRLYRLIQTHTSQVDWFPPAVPALWQDIGSALEVPAFTRALWSVVDTASADYTEIIRAQEV